jgi:hypothetical protein
VRVLRPDFAVHNFTATQLKAQLCEEIEGPLAGEIGAWWMIGQARPLAAAYRNTALA